MASKKRRRPVKSAPPVVQPAIAPEPQVVGRRRAQPVRSPDRSDAGWNSTGLLVLLALVFILQIPIGAIIHVISHTNPLIVDLFFFQPQYLVVACVLVMPLARRLTAQPRNLRLLESLSLGIMYALLSLMVGTAFVHPANSSISTDQFIKQLQLRDGLLIALSDVLALVGTVALYPGFSRLLGAPGRRARARMIGRTETASASRKPSDRSPKGGAKSKR